MKTNANAGVLRVNGLDGIRFICALWVCMSHGAEFPLATIIDKSTQFGWFVNGIYGMFFNGGAAVIVFFVISGFCIHFPSASGKTMPWKSYYVRRLTRIIAPLLAALALCSIKQAGIPDYGGTVYWTIVCELHYYILYPVFLILSRKIGWIGIIVAAYVVSFCLLLLDYDTGGNFASGVFGPTWLVGLPIWLLGCLLADRYQAQKMAQNIDRIWVWRFGVWILSVLCLFLRFHASIGYPWSLSLFAIIVFFWLRVELAYYSIKPSLAFLQFLGAQTYSLYLFHIIGIGWFENTIAPRIYWLGAIGNWFLMMACLAVGTYLFYLFIEKPSHDLAKKISN